MADQHDDEDDVQDDVNDADHRDDYVEGDEVVYGSSTGFLIIIPTYEAMEWAELRRALQLANTWGQFKSMVSEERYDEVRRRYNHPDWEPATEDDEPDDSMPFDDGYIWGYADGDWPEWWQQEWEKWLPYRVQEQYGYPQTSTLNGAFLNLDVTDEANIIALLEHYGYTCIRDETLTRQAIGNFDFATKGMLVE